jgi:ATP/maltotriose-dependent transcriptional regulator MalT
MDRTLFSAAAHIDGDYELATELRVAAAEIARPFDTPGWMAADFVLMAQEVLARDDADEFAFLITMVNEAMLTHPLGRLTLAYMQARTGDFEGAERNLRLALRQHDLEASFLLVGTRAASVSALIGNVELTKHLIGSLEPWAHHIAIDGQGLWCDGPVSLALADLHLASGNKERARLMIEFASDASQELNIASCFERVERLRARIGPRDRNVTAAHFGLTERQLLVLESMVAGKTNPAIAKELSFSVSTIRLETMQIFDKLGVSGRREAAAKAIQTGLLQPG